MNNPLPRVAAIHDLSGFGKASLTVVIPILSTMGVQVVPLVTAVLSSHSKYKGFHFIDLTEHLQPIIDHWKELKVHFDAIYSGFLGSHLQIEIVERFIDDFKTPDTFVVVDPVLGDNGALYTPLSQNMVIKMRRLVAKADIITPNLTEVALLLGQDYNPTISDEDLRSNILKLADMGAKTVIVTSVPITGQPRRTSVLAYSTGDRRFWKVTCDYLPAHYPGTGDAFTSIITGALIQGDSLPIAIDRAVQFISMGVRSTFGYDYDPDQGFMLERVLPNLNAPVQMSTYEWFEA
ncbi:MAG: pyridoxamine kinase [Bacteroidetes bacterium GWE2_42_24]|nr:MAG: pyridoxamine kinase [Bacteroidetes bacterium GWE2_42_24]OFY30597.1 MAG: pyridoxamine kinase [Bacteroidetes bacterium GWF2_43_11]